MNNFVISQVRTYVPIVVGALLTWVASSLHIVLGPSSEAGLVTLTVAGVSAGYYGLVHLLEQRWPQVGVLLGAAKLPTYQPASTSTDEPGADAVLAVLNAATPPAAPTA